MNIDEWLIRPDKIHSNKFCYHLVGFYTLQFLCFCVDFFCARKGEIVCVCVCECVCVCLEIPITNRGHFLWLGKEKRLWYETKESFMRINECKR